MTVQAPAHAGDRRFLEAMLAADARDRLAALPGAVREQLVELQVRAQLTQQAAAWPEAEDWILLDDDGAPAGRLLLGRAGGALHVVDLRVAAPQRGQGIGTAALGRLLAQADAAGMDVHLHVDRANPARRLYERLGFVAVDEEAEGPDVAMRRTPGRG